MKISIAKTMVTKAFDNDMVGGHTVKTFRRVKRKLKKGSNARRRVITPSEYLKLVKAAYSHLRPIIEVAYNTGMRRGEIRKLRWSHIDREKGFITAGHGHQGTKVEGHPNEPSCNCCPG
jgi:integrase